MQNRLTALFLVILACMYSPWSTDLLSLAAQEDPGVLDREPARTNLDEFHTPRKALMKVSRSSPQATFRNNRGLVLYAQNRLSEASREFLEAIRLDPQNPSAMNNLGVVLCGKGEYDQALHYFKMAQAQSAPDSPFLADVLNNMGFVYTRNRMPRQAFQCYSAARAIMEKEDSSRLHHDNQGKFESVFKVRMAGSLEGHTVFMKFYP